MQDCGRVAPIVEGYVVKEDQDLPGVVFQLLNVTTIHRGQKGVKLIRVTLDAEVSDDAVWRIVEEKLKTFKVYAAVDFKSELLEVLRKENAALESKLKTLELSYKTVVEESKQMRTALDVLQRGLG
jgi:hypothetical protein